MPILKHFYITVVSVIFFVDNKQSSINNTLYYVQRGWELHKNLRMEIIISLTRL